MPLQALSLDLIDVYGGTQTRVKTDDEAIASYADDMAQGAVFPPIIVYFDGATHWLADGFHRYLATKRTGAATIQAQVHAGGRIDALRSPSARMRPMAFIATMPTSATRWRSRSRNGPSSPTPCSRRSYRRVSPELVRRCRQEMVQASASRTPPR